MGREGEWIRADHSAHKADSSRRERARVWVECSRCFPRQDKQTDRWTCESVHLGVKSMAEGQKEEAAQGKKPEEREALTKHLSSMISAKT